MQSWHTTYLGLKELPRDITGFELQAFFTYSRAELDVINTRRSDAHRLGLALHIGFLRLSGRVLNAVRIVPIAVWNHLGTELGIPSPELASLKALYGRRSTLYEHQKLAYETLKFRWMTEHQRRFFVRAVREEVARCADKDQLMVFARRWLYERTFLIEHDRALRAQVVAALIQFEEETAAQIVSSVPAALLKQWQNAVSSTRVDGQNQQSWLWEAPAKHSSRQISEVFERIELLYELQVHHHLTSLTDLVVRRYARKLAHRPPSVGARIREPGRTIEVACFLRYCLLTATDQVILMIQRRSADLWRQASATVTDTGNWAPLYQQLIRELGGLAQNQDMDAIQLRERLAELVNASQQAKPPSRASQVRERLFDGIRPVRSLLAEIGKLPWKAQDSPAVLIALNQLVHLYADKRTELPSDFKAPLLGRVWSEHISAEDRNKAMRALEVATLFSLRRAVRNGSVWVEHSLLFRGRSRLFFPPLQWQEVVAADRKLTV